MAVKVTEVPEHTGFELAPIDTLTAFKFTIIVIVFDVAGLPVGHVVFDVRTHIIWSPFAGVYE